jgi:hypothetical protein
MPGAKVVVAARTRSDDTPAAATFVSGDVITSERIRRPQSRADSHEFTPTRSPAPSAGNRGQSEVLS